MALGTKILIVMVCVTAVLILVNPSILTTGNLPTSYLGVNLTTVNNTTFATVDTNTSFYTGMDVATTQTTTPILSGVIGFISDLTRVFGTLRTLVTLTYAPSVFLQSAEAPFEIVLIVTVVWTVLWALAILGFVRGRDF